MAIDFQYNHIPPPSLQATIHTKYDCPNMDSRRVENYNVFISVVKSVVSALDRGRALLRMPILNNEILVSGPETYNLQLAHGEFFSAVRHGP